MTMRRFSMVVAGLAVAAAPAVWGLAGNSSFSHTVPVQLPPQARVADDAPVKPTVAARPSPLPSVKDDHGRHPEPGDDRGSATSTVVAPATSSAGRAHSVATSRSREVEPGDDRGTAVEPGDDRGAAAEPGDDRGGRTSSTTSATSNSSSGPGKSAVAPVEESHSGRGGSGGGHDDAPGHR
jgi:hypothetical protein